jgi:hypothetical protein
MKINSLKSIAHWLARVTLLLGLVLSVGGSPWQRAAHPKRSWLSSRAALWEPRPMRPALTAAR